MSECGSAGDNKRPLATEFEAPTKQKRAKKITIERLLKVIKNGQVEQLQEVMKDESYYLARLSTRQWTSLFNSAADNCRIDQVEVLLNRQYPYARPLSVPVVYSRVLRSACLKNDLELMELALQRGAAIDAAGDDGLSCLHIAAKQRNIEAMQLLLKNGADINLVTLHTSKDWPGHTALRLACALSHREVIGFLLDHGAALWMGGQNALVDAARNVRILEMILNSVDIDIADENGRTALRQACFSPEPDKPVKALLQHGANPNISIHQPLVPLLVAVCRKNPPKSIVKLLLSHGAAVDAVDSQGRTALMYACSFEYQNAVKLLLEYGADVNIIGNDGNTALMHIFNGRCACLPMLLERGADVSIPYSHGVHTGKTVLEVVGQGDSREARMIREAAERQACSQPVLK